MQHQHDLLINSFGKLLKTFIEAFTDLWHHKGIRNQMTTLQRIQWPDARMNPDKCGHSYLICVDKEILNPQIEIEYIRVPVVEAKKGHQTSNVSL